MHACNLLRVMISKLLNFPKSIIRCSKGVGVTFFCFPTLSPLYWIVDFDFWWLRWYFANFISFVGISRFNSTHYIVHHVWCWRTCCVSLRKWIILPSCDFFKPIIATQRWEFRSTSWFLFDWKGNPEIKFVLIRRHRWIEVECVMKFLWTVNFADF